MVRRVADMEVVAVLCYRFGSERAPIKESVTLVKG